MRNLDMQDLGNQWFVIVGFCTYPIHAFIYYLSFVHDCLRIECV